MTSYSKQVQAKFLEHENSVNRTAIVGRGRARTYGRASDAADSSDLNYFSADLRDPSFGIFAKDAYKSEKGYAIRINPNTGEKEMFIAGTRHGSQWGLNILDSITYGADKFINSIYNAEVAPELGLPESHMKMLGRLDVWREQKQRDFERIAYEQGVDVIYGHSRGGAMAADLNMYKGKKIKAKRIGLDAAMLLANKTHTLNLNEGGGWNPLGLFDEAIGITGQRNVTFDLSTWQPHQVWASNP